MKPAVDRAIWLALVAHGHQVDKAGEPYILHPLRVMLQMQTDEERRVAVLHDVLEDTPLKLDDLRMMGFPERELQAIDALTRRKGEDYRAFIDRVSHDDLARRVKLADLRDNMDPTRNAPEAQKLRKRYLAAQRRLTGNKGETP